MKIVLLAAVAALSSVEASQQSALHLRIHSKTSCTITNESQCNGQNWTGSTCCADPNYECRWSDDGQNVQRCQKKKNGGGTQTGGGGNQGAGTVGDWGDCTGYKKCKSSGWQCIAYSKYYAQCKPPTLPAGELCGQNDGTNVWYYDKCPSNQKCSPVGKDYRCTNKKHHHHKQLSKDGSCTITNESQCDGQNWTGSTCCADSSYECRWSDDGQNVKRCQKIGTYGGGDGVDGDSGDSDDSNYGSDDSQTGGYTSYVGDWGDCTSPAVGCSGSGSVCVVYSAYYAQCKPATLPSGELCGQNDGTNVWYYDYCPSGETCQPNGSDYRCTKSKKKHRRHHHHRA